MNDTNIAEAREKAVMADALEQLEERFQAAKNLLRSVRYGNLSQHLPLKLRTEIDSVLNS